MSAMRTSSQGKRLVVPSRSPLTRQHDACVVSQPATRSADTVPWRPLNRYPVRRLSARVTTLRSCNSRRRSSSGWRVPSGPRYSQNVQPLVCG